MSEWSLALGTLSHHYAAQKSYPIKIHVLTICQYPRSQESIDYTNSCKPHCGRLIVTCFLRLCRTSLLCGKNCFRNKELKLSQILAVVFINNRGRAFELPSFQYETYSKAYNTTHIEMLPLNPHTTDTTSKFSHKPHHVVH